MRRHIGEALDELEHLLRAGRIEAEDYDVVRDHLVAALVENDRITPIIVDLSGLLGD